MSEHWECSSTEGTLAVWIVGSAFESVNSEGHGLDLCWPNDPVKIIVLQKENMVNNKKHSTCNFNEVDDDETEIKGRQSKELR